MESLPVIALGENPFYEAPLNPFCKAPSGTIHVAINHKISVVDERKSQVLNKLALIALGAAVTYMVMRSRSQEINISVPNTPVTPLPVTPIMEEITQPLALPSQRFLYTEQLSFENYNSLWGNGDLTLRGTFSDGSFQGLKVDQHTAPNGWFRYTTRQKRLITFEGDQLTALRNAIGQWGLDDVLKAKELSNGTVLITHGRTGQQFIGSYMSMAWDSPLQWG